MASSLSKIIFATLCMHAKVHNSLNRIESKAGNSECLNIKNHAESYVKEKMSAIDNLIRRINRVEF